MASVSSNGLADLAQLAIAIELVQDAVVVYDNEARIVLANERLLAATGYPREDLVGRPALILLPQTLREELTPRMLVYARAPVVRALGEGLGSRIQRKDGTTFEAQMGNSPITAASTKLVMVTIREVTSLSLEEIQFRGLLDSNPDATLICSPEGSVLLSNSTAQRLFRREHIEMFNQPLTSLFPERYAISLARTLDEAYKASTTGASSTGARSLDVELMDGDERDVVPVEVSVSGMRTDKGVSMRVSVRDISERRRLLRETESMKDEFLATVSHELRTPLTSVLGYGELLEDLGPDDLSLHARSLLDVVIRNARRELRLVGDLLTMVQIGEGTFRIHLGQVNVSRLIRDAVEGVIPVAYRASVAVSLVMSGEDIFVEGDADRLGQAVDNLLTNSIKFSPPSGEVTVAVTASTDAVTVAVTNYGVEIPPSDLEHVFDRLFRGDNAVVAEKQGVGLGLSIVRSIVEAHGGEASATCAGSRTCFQIDLPRVAVVDVN